MNNKIKDKVVTILFSSILIIFFLINAIKKDDDISISERRKLEKFPTLTINNLMDGTFFKKFETYTTDQFIKRDYFRKLKVNLELNIKKNYNNLYNYNGYIVEQTFPLNKNSVINLANKMNSIKETYLTNNNIYFTIVPDKNYFINNGNLKLDYNELTNLMKNNLKDFNYIDIFSILNLDDYYKTDTHWKQENIKKVALLLSKNMNFDFYDNYNELEITSFKGVYSGQLPIKTELDKITILTNDIINNNSSNKELIVFRDSYGSSLVPLLIQGYKKITVIDTRYVSPKILNEYVDFNNKDVLFIYGVISVNNSSSIR